jgi:hypothetical protein
MHDLAVGGSVVDLKEDGLLSPVLEPLAEYSTTMGVALGSLGTLDSSFLGMLAVSSLSIDGKSTMKMMSSTSTMSMSGVTLISPLAPLRSPFVAIAMITSRAL